MGLNISQNIIFGHIMKFKNKSKIGNKGYHLFVIIKQILITENVQKHKFSKNLSDNACPYLKNF